MYRSRVSYKTKLERDEEEGTRSKKKPGESQEIETTTEGEAGKGDESRDEKEREDRQKLGAQNARRECEHPPARRGISSWLSHAFSAN